MSFLSWLKLPGRGKQSRLEQAPAPKPAKFHVFPSDSKPRGHKRRRRLAMEARRRNVQRLIKQRRH